MVELACETPLVPFCVVEAPRVEAASAGLEVVVALGAVLADDAGAVGAVVPEAADVVAPLKRLGVAAEEAGAVVEGVAPKRGFAAAGAVVAGVLPPNNPPGLVVAAPPNGLAAAVLAGAAALVVVDAASLGLAPNSPPAEGVAPAGWELAVAPPNRAGVAVVVVSGFFPKRLPPASLAPPPKRAPPAAGVLVPVEPVFPKSDEPPAALDAAGWLVEVLLTAGFAG